MRGGYRSGGGRPKGSRDKKPRKRPDGGAPAKPGWKNQVPLVEDSKARIKKLLEAALTVKAKAFYNLVDKMAKGEALSAVEIKNLTILERELFEAVGDAQSEECSPEDFLIRVVQGEKATQEQIRAAEVLLRKKSGWMGKKEQREERAKKAQEGKFAAGPAPLQRVK